MRERIEIRAYELFLESDSVHGQDLEHWLTAERELLEAAPAAKPARRVAGARARA